MTPFMTVLLAVISSAAFGSLLTFFMTKKKRKAETDGVELDNIGKAVKIWKDLTEELTAKIELQDEQIKELKIDYEALKRLYEAQCNNCQYRKAYEDQQK